MIKLNQTTLPDLDGFFDKFSATKIKANELSYGHKFPFLLFWCQYIENSLTAVICRFEQAVILVAKKGADLNEIKDFLFAVGFNSLEGEYELISRLVPNNINAYNVVYKKTAGDLAPCPTPNIKAVFDTLYSKENEHIKPTDFEAFYADLSHRIRHGTAAAVLTQNSATAIASHITKENAVISGVAVKPNNRGKGLGLAALKSLESHLAWRNIFAAVDDSVLEFYVKAGYTAKYKIAVYEYEE